MTRMSTGRTLALAVGVLAVASALLYYVFGSEANAVGNAVELSSTADEKRELSAAPKGQPSYTRQPIDDGYCLITVRHATSGKPLAGVAITPAQSPGTVLYTEVEITQARLSDERGQLVVAIRDFEQSGGHFWAFKSGFQAKRGSVSEARSEANVSLRPCIKYAIQVIDAEGNPLPGVRLSVHRGPNSALKDAKLGTTVRADGAGTQSWVGESGQDGSCVIDGVHVDGMPAYISIESPGWLPIGNQDWSDGLSRKAPSVKIQLARALYGVARVANAEYIAHSLEPRAYGRGSTRAIDRSLALEHWLQRETGAPIVHVMMPGRRLKSVTGKVWTERFAAHGFSLPLHEYRPGEPIAVTSIEVDTAAASDVGRLQLVVDQPSGRRALPGIRGFLKRRKPETLYMRVAFDKDPVVVPVGEYYAMLLTPVWLAGRTPRWRRVNVRSGKTATISLKGLVEMRKVRLSVTIDGGWLANGIGLNLSSPVTLEHAVLATRSANPITCFLPVGPIHYESLGPKGVMARTGTFIVSPARADGEVEDIRVDL